MAFKVKKRQAAPVNSSESELVDIEAGDIASANSMHNVVATQGWVYHILRGIWDWTRHFATETLNVAGQLDARGLTACQAQIGDLYAGRITLLDDNGREAVLYVKDGKLQIDYDFNNVYVWPGDGDGKMDVRSFVYRNSDIARNFVGLTPYETYLNFIPFTSPEQKEFRMMMCPYISAADGEDELLGKTATNIAPTLLFVCKQAQKIASAKIVRLDEAGNEVVVKEFEIPEGKTWRKMTINMPAFKKSEDEDLIKVQLPGNGSDKIQDSYRMFLPPFLVPPPIPCPFIGPPRVNPDIFDDNAKFQNGLLEEDIFAGLDEEVEATQTPIKPTYDVVYEDYAAENYFNVVVKRSHLDTNKEQYIVVETEDA